MSRELDQLQLDVSSGQSITDASRATLKAVPYTYSSFADSYAQYAILRNAWSDFKGPGVATIVGLLCSAAASIWSVWL